MFAVFKIQFKHKSGCSFMFYLCREFMEGRCLTCRQNSISNLTHMIPPNPPLTDSSSHLILSSKRQKNLYLNLVHFNSHSKSARRENRIKPRQADSTPWKRNLSRCFSNMYLLHVRVDAWADCAGEDAQKIHKTPRHWADWDRVWKAWAWVALVTVEPETRGNSQVCVGPD